MNFLDYKSRSVKSQSDFIAMIRGKTKFFNIAFNEECLLYFNLLVFYKTLLIILSYDRVGLLR